MTGRPSRYTQETADAICELLASGLSLVTICKRADMPGYRTVMDWLRDDEEFRTEYARAREAQAEHMAEEILEIADHKGNDIKLSADGTPVFDDAGNPVIDHDNIQRAKLRVETRKWLASKLLPKKYGERLHHADPDGKPLAATFTIHLGDAGREDA